MRGRVSVTHGCRDFYLDESGNSGDLVNSGSAFDFGRQPLFVLACVGSDEGALAAEVADVRARHRVRGDELKSTLLKTRPDAVGDLIARLLARGSPIFVEVVEKRFFVCTTMVNHFVVPPVAHEFDSRPDVIQMRNDVAEYLHANMPLAVMRTYLDACAVPSPEATRRAFEALLAWLRPESIRDDKAKFLLQLAEEGLAGLETAARDDPESRAFLPEPDGGRAGRLYWILPHLSSLTNVYARINLYRERKMEGVRLIHDEQLQFDRILKEGKLAAERFAAEGRAWPLPHADYSFEQSAQLIFQRSCDSVGIQVADVVAGFVMRFVQQVNTEYRLPAREAVRAFRTLLEAADPRRGVGANFVVSHGDFMRLGLVRA